VLNGTIADADFAADLAKVIRGTASDDYKIPARFFANTYPTPDSKIFCATSWLGSPAIPAPPLASSASIPATAAVKPTA
jgi:hypothetical protein